MKSKCKILSRSSIILKNILGVFFVLCLTSQNLALAQSKPTYQTFEKLIKSGNVEKVVDYVNKGFAKGVIEEEHGWTVLSSACFYGLTPIVAAIIKKKNIDLNSKDFAGYTPILIAVQRRNLDIVTLLVSAGADPTIRSKTGERALDLADAAGPAYVKALAKSPKVKELKRGQQN